MKYLLLLIFTVRLAFQPLAATPHSLESLALDQAILIALRQHPELAEIAAQLDAAEGRVEQAAAFPNPEGIARIESAPVDRDTATRAEYVAGLSQPIPLGRRLSAAKQLESLAALQLSQEREALLLDLTRRVRNAFATALLASELTATHSNLVAGSEQLVSLVRTRVDAGDTTPVELLRIQAEAARHELDHRRASTARQKAFLALAETLGSHSIEITSLAGDLHDALNLPELHQHTRDLASLSAPQLAAAEAALDTQRARLDLLQARRIPDLNVDLLYRRLQSTRENAFDAGIRIQIPIFDRSRGNIREATANIRAAEARLSRTRLELEHALEENRLELVARLDAANLLKTAVLPNLAEATRVAQLRFEAGDISLSELLLTRRDAALAQLDYLESLHAIFQSWAALHSLALSAQL